MGSSLICYAYQYSFTKYKNQDQHLEPHNISIMWFGKKGMVWEDVEPGFRDLVQQFGYPDVLMIHCGGISIGTMSFRRLQKYMKLTVTNIHSMRPNCRIIWPQILPRKYYRHMFSHIAADSTR
uniref:Uncharacterized protein n=1 Tax=Magallana gigas TaxID=29159 RepID=K1PYB2_MAGGI